jgi:formyl-CoA transferase
MDADVVVENFRPGVKHKLGIDYETLRKVNPKLIYASLSGFGQDGPYKDRPGVDQVIQGMGGLMSVTGLPGQGPVRVGIPIADLTAGIFLAYGIVMALYDRERTGEGQWVKTSLLASIIQMLDFQSTRWLIDREVPPQAGNNHPTGTPMGVFATRDGHINIAAASQKMFGRFCEAVGKPEWLTDPQFHTPKQRNAHRDAINAAIEDITRTQDSAHWVKLLNAAGVPTGPIYAIDQMYADEQVKLLDLVKTVNHPTLGKLNIVGQAVEMVRTPSTIRTAAPNAGEHTNDILTSMGLDRDRIDALRKRNAV